MESVDSARRDLEQLGLGNLADTILARRLPSIRLAATGRSAKAVNRLGGRPNLPKEVAWPALPNGQPLSLIAQFDLATLPVVGGLDLPKSGSLFFFYDADEQPWGFDPKHKSHWRVVYHASPLTANPLRSPHADLDGEFRFKGVVLEATSEKSLPCPDKSLSQRLMRDQFKLYVKLVVHARQHRIGGHPNVIQGSLALEAQLVSQGIYCGDSKGYEKGRKLGLDKGAEDWQLLLQVDSEERAGMRWGDLGRLYFMIRKDDVAQCRFDRVWAILQCT